MRSSLCQEFFKFGAVGLVATIVHISIAIIMIRFWQCNLFQANIAAYSVAMLFSFVFNSRWSFNRQLSTSLFLRFFTANSAVLGVIMGGSLFLTYFRTDPVVGTFLIALCSPLVSFTAHKFWTYSG
ncbi:MAG: GtrA family protein [Gammaproteobacteria bacterium]